MGNLTFESLSLFLYLWGEHPRVMMVTLVMEVRVVVVMVI